MTNFNEDILECVQEAKVDFWNMKVQKYGHYITLNYHTNCMPKNYRENVLDMIVSLFFKTFVQNIIL
jgi:hypothetical protein